MSPASLRSASFLATNVVLLALLIFGVVEPAAFWFGMYVGAVGHGFLLAHSQNDLLGRQNALVEQLLGQRIHAVRCAGCHKVAALAGGGEPFTEDGTLKLPPGWGEAHDRPYCAECL